MKTTSIYLLLGLLALSTQLPSASCISAGEKPGTCPPNPFRCTLPGHNLCNTDSECPGIRKCCHFNCGKSCRNPLEKPGTCPPNPFRCTLPGRNLCNSDTECPGIRKCCYFNCGKRCRNPLVTSDVPDDR
ncbi:waprin-Enh1-like [Rhineura floridana]|uniref:waprin-Enh1-like n=1 Tax=Rhineura floridana TaxID=261503 RepID=UPI002AC86F74|nr:waprin-Enh1-like [Rhineura floridana]